MKKLFEINGVDFTQYINERKYSMHRLALYQEWIDGNFNVRRAHQRWQIEGSFVMTFYSEVEYDSFVAAVENVTDADGWCPVSVFVEDDKTFSEINAFVAYKPHIAWTNEASGSLPAVAEVKVTITER